ncbi:unnamed protein product [Prunus armeniaca]
MLEQLHPKKQGQGKGKARRVLERQEQEEEEIKCKRAEEDREADEEEEEMVIAVCMLNKSRQHHRCRGLNVDRHRQSQATLRMLAYGASAEQVDEIAPMGKSTILECLVRFCDAIENLHKREYLANLWLRTSEGLYKKLRLEVPQE